MIALLLLACAGPDYGLAPATDPAEGPPALGLVAPPEPIATESGGSATASWVVGEDRRDDFDLDLDGSTPLVDFLFVVDPSSSMKSGLDRFQAAVSGLAASDAFPARSRIAVMSTTPGDPEDLRRPHPAVQKASHARRLPGFLSLVSQERIARYRAWPGARADAFTSPGCAAWFSPDQVDASGTPCLVAHASPALLLLLVEDGLLAFAQLVDKVGADRLFRPGAAVNVVLLSDTYGPGFVPRDEDFQAWAWHDQLLAAHPTGEELGERIAAQVDLAAFRVHAVLPLSDCGERGVVRRLGADELDVADATGGVVADACTVEDYGEVVEEIVATGARLQAPVFALSGRAGQVRGVTVDGRPVAHRLGKGGRTVTLGRLPEAGAEVRVQYAPVRR